MYTLVIGHYKENMKLSFFIFTITSILFSCNKTEKANSKNNSVDSVNAVIYPIDDINNSEVDYEYRSTNDSIYKVGDFLFEAKQDANFEFVRKGEKPKLKTKGDTLYADNETILLGDINEITSSGIFKKFSFKSKFEDFQTNEIYHGRLASPNFNTDPNAKHYLTRIIEGCKKMGVNFAGHYTIVEWGCGALCQEMAIVDRITGKIIFSEIPFDTADGHSGTIYSINSRMLIINTESLSEFDDYEPGYRRFDSWRKPAVYEINKGKLFRIE
jgi:hypothetical protein